jgi:hypothetical protein
MGMSPRTLRPGGAFTPKSIAGLQLWLDASDQSTMTLNGTTVSEWRSKVSSIAVSQTASALAQPTLTANYVGSRSALTFDGGDVLYSASAPLAIAPCTSFIVYAESAVVSFAGILGGTPATGNDFSDVGGFITSARESGNLTLRAARTGQPAATEMAASSTSQGASAYGRKLLTAVVDASSATVRMNGVAGTADSHAVTGSSSGAIVGGRFVGGAVSASFRLNGVVCEILHYSTALTASQVSVVEKWLALRWGVTL